MFVFPIANVVDLDLPLSYYLRNIAHPGMRVVSAISHMPALTISGPRNEATVLTLIYTDAKRHHPKFVVEFPSPTHDHPLQQ